MPTSTTALLSTPWEIRVPGPISPRVLRVVMNERLASPADADESGLDPWETVRREVCEALASGDTSVARRLLDRVEASAPAIFAKETWQKLQDVSAWTDGWLVAAVRRTPPDEPALDVLAERHWKSLFGRCQMLTLDREKAMDLAQDAWCRVLRNRHALKPDGNFPAYLATIATNLWRDRHRASRRAGELGEGRVLSLEAERAMDDGATVRLQDLLPDLATLRSDEQRRLKLDLDQALSRLTPLLHDVMLARFLQGESCAEIGRRHGRTEQTVSGWVRQGIQQMKQFLAEARGGRQGHL